MRSKSLLTAVAFANALFLCCAARSQWVQTNGPGSYNPVRACVVSGTNIFAGIYGNGVFRSTDKGLSWTAASAGLPYTSGYTLAISGTNLFAGTAAAGVFLSTDSGMSWTGVNSGLTNTVVVTLAVSEENIFAGTSGGGVWRRPLSQMIASVNRATSELPGEFLLLQNYPNPFNPSTTIRYALPSKSLVTLSVYSTLGQELDVLSQGVQEAGYHDVQFNASRLASGVYFCRLHAGSFVQTKKLILLR